MSVIKSKYTIIIPNNVVILYCNKKNILTSLGPLSQKSIKINLELKLISSIQAICVTINPISRISNNDKKKLKVLQGTTTALIKQLILETSTSVLKKLKLIGVGYRIFYVDDFKDKLLLFKLGFSHPIYCKVPENFKNFCLKQTKIFLLNNSFQEAGQLSASIQSFKLPEPYKGKGILYENTKIQLKEGKKTKK